MERLYSIAQVFDRASEIICFFDNEGTIKYLNQSGEQELQTSAGMRNIRDILPNFFTDDTDIFLFAERNSQREIKTDAYRTNHTCFPVIIRIGVDAQTFDEPMGVAVINDIARLEAQKKQILDMEEHMKEIMKQQDQFVANLTHELRTPVNGIKGHIRNLKEKEESSSNRRVMDIVLQCCDNMEKIINNLLDYAKIENGQFDITPEPFDLRKCIETSINMVESVANEKGLELQHHVSDDIPEIIIGDEFRLSQVLNNILNNAIKFTSVGRVTIEVYKTRHENNDIELTFFIMDTGIGVSANDRDKMFKSFSQADGSITRNYGGTGLGLYVCKQIVELMGGHIELDSEEGKGTTFIFTVNMKSEISQPVTESTYQTVSIASLKNALMSSAEQQSLEEKYVYGTSANRGVIDDTIDKLTLCIELENWAKAEQFADNLKKILETAPKEVSSMAFRIQLNVRKEKYDKSMEFIDKFKELIDSNKTAGENV